MNIKLSYLYRDAGNNKLWGAVVFANGQQLSAEQVTAQLRAALIDQAFFDAAAVSIPELAFTRHDHELDHGWHEFDTASATDEPVSDDRYRDICVLLQALAASCREIAG